ncbi:MAG: hypothetical protein Q8N99_01190 [Nanoarchaeota archaeon]|nr:hypothetical protein [Nanoarchaeota archaeon]
MHPDFRKYKNERIAGLESIFIDWSNCLDNDLLKFRPNDVWKQFEESLYESISLYEGSVKEAARLDEEYKYLTEKTESHPNCAKIFSRLDLLLARLKDEIEKRQYN